MFSADPQYKPHAFCLGVSAALLLMQICVVTHAGAEDAPAPAAAPHMRRSHADHPTRPSAIDARIKLLAAELGLNEQQQAETRKILLSQREQVQRLWNDDSVASGQRIATTQAISDQTADRIRALLTEEQKKRYKAKRQSDNAPTASGPSVDDWMNAANTGI